MHKVSVYHFESFPSGRMLDVVLPSLSLFFFFLISITLFKKTHLQNLPGEIVPEHGSLWNVNETLAVTSSAFLHSGLQQ